MTRKTIEETERFHVFLYKRDLDYLRRRFGNGASSDSRLGVSTACREIIRARVKKLRAIENARLSQLLNQNQEERIE
jgi:hypothetical protein